MPQSQAQVFTSSKNDFFAGLETSDRESIFAAGKARKIPANSVVTRHGTSADHLYYLVRGCMRMFYTTADGRKILLLWLAPGDLLGGASLLASRRHYLVSSETVKDSDVILWDRVTVRGFIKRFPQLLDNALTIAAEYVDWYMSAHVSLTCYSARERLAHVLLGLSRAIGEKVSGGIEIDVTNEDLANAANITPYTASRLMSEWQKGRAIIKRRGKVLLRSPERLLLTTV
jgi:CRP-like cAMP-binding protein